MSRINILTRTSLAFIVFMTLTSVIALVDSTVITNDSITYDSNFQIIESTRVYRGSKISGFISTNASAIFSLKLLQVDGKEVELFSRELLKESNYDIEINTILDIGGILFLNLSSIVNSTWFRAALVNIYVSARIDFGYIYNSNLVLFNSIIGVGIVSGTWDKIRKKKVRLPSFYGKVQLIDLIGVFAPTVLAIASFSFALPDAREDKAIMLQIFSNNGQNIYFKALYWALIILLGSLYYTKKESHIKELWTTYKGRERTYIFRSLYVNLEVFLILGGTIIYYVIAQYLILYNYSLTQEEWILCLTIATLIVISASLHLGIFALIFLSYRNSEVVFYTLGYLFDTLMRSQTAFTTLPSSTINRISSEYNDQWVIPQILFLASVFYLGGYKIYKDSEVRI